MKTVAEPSFHPDQFLLNEYVAGSAPGAVALALAAHLEWCASCRREVGELAAIGAELFAQLDPVPVADDGLQRVLAHIDGQAADHAASAAQVRRDGLPLPSLVAQLVPHGLDALRWTRASGSLRTARLRFGDRQREVALHHIVASGRIPEHGHAGNEYTLVLRGSFSDRQGCYQRGDFIARGPGDVHRPVAAEDGDCLCLAVLDAPVRLTGWLGYVINPFLRLHPG
jgi:putative transcriptional regulator